MEDQVSRQDLLRERVRVRQEMPLGKYMKNNWALYMMVIPGILNLIIFKYAPMFGILAAFQNYVPKFGFFHSSFVGLKHFETFFRDPFCWRIIRNTILLGVTNLVFGFPAPIILALLFNELRYPLFKKVCQTISYMPFFLSEVIVIGLTKELFSVDGIVNDVITAFGGSAINFFSLPQAFRPLYIGTGIWSGIGYSSIIYLAAIAGINIEQYESAVLDGASRFQQIIYITLPSIMPTVGILFIMSVGGILGNNMQKILLMYSPRIYETADVISTYVYRYGIESAGNHLSYSTAVGLLFNFISFFFLLITNFVSKKLSDISLF